MSKTSTVSTGIAGKYLTVVVGAEAFGIAVLQVREIIRLQSITAVPQMPEFVKGVINLRGRVIAIIDLRVKFGLPAELAERTCIVVVQVKHDGEKPISIGLVVDYVEEVLNLTLEDIEPTPDFGVTIDTAYILGMAKIKGKVKTLLDIDRVVAPSVMSALAAETTQTA
jgi:purine-binding chemotaxis protein CheW